MRKKIKLTAEQEAKKQALKEKYTPELEKISKERMEKKAEKQANNKKEKTELKNKVEKNTTVIDKNVKKQNSESIKSVNKKCKKITQFFVKYLNDNPENMKLLEEIVKDKNRTVLVDSPCGSGKTYVINELFNLVKVWSTKEGRKFLNVILCPSRIQNIQNASSYGLTHLVKESSSRKLELNTNYSCVYELFPKIAEFVKDNREENIHFNIIIDEAQQLLSDVDFREGVRALIDSVEELKALNIDCNVICLSGTPEGLLSIPKDITSVVEFDTVIKFERRKQEVKADKLNIHIGKRKVTIKDKEGKDKDEVVKFYDYVLSELLKQENNLTHIESKSGIKKIAEALNENGKKTQTLSSEDKSYKYMTSEDGKDLLVVYDNEILQGLIGDSQIPAGQNICTSSINAGTNNTFAPEGFACNVVLLNPHNCDISEIVQFCNRTRPFYDSINIFLRETEEGKEKEIKTLEEIRVEFEKAAERHKKKVETFIEAEKEDPENTRRDIYNNAQRYLKIMKYGEETASFRGVITVNEDLEVEIDRYLLSCVIYKEYNSRFYYHPEELKNALSERIATNEVNMFYGGEIIAKCDSKKREKKDTKAEAIKALEEFDEADIKRLEQIIKENMKLDDEKSSTDKKIKTFLTYRPYKKIIDELTFYGIKLDELLKDIEEHKDTTLKEVYEKYATAKYVYLNRRYVKVMRTDNQIISKESYIKELESDYKKGDINKKDYDEALKLIEDGFFLPTKGFCNKTVNIEITASNIVLKYLYVLNKNGNLKQTTLNSKLINAIKQEINAFEESFYSTAKTIDLIKKHFWTREDNGILKINGIRLGYRN